MKFRLANQTDASALAMLHYKCSKKQTGSFLHELGFAFLRAYYKVHLRHKNSVILIAGNENEMHGFVSGTLETQDLLKAMRKNRIVLMLACLPALLKSPLILSKLIERYRFIHQKANAKQYGVTHGPKIDYWAWDPDKKENYSVILFKRFLNIVFDMGFISIHGEIDEDNENIVALHERMGAKVVHEIVIEGNRKRIIIEYTSKKN